MSKAGRIALRVFLVLALLSGSSARAMTAPELAAQLKAAKADEADLVASYPSDINESKPPFLGGATYIEVEVRLPSHPVILKLVRAADGRFYWPLRGPEELAR